MKRKALCVLCIGLAITGVLVAKTVTMDCGTCGGRGRVPCSTCGGSGWFYNGTVTDPWTNETKVISEKCSACRGSGEVKCSACNGRGKITRDDPYGLYEHAD